MKPFATLVLALLLYASISGCKKDSSKSSDQGITGTWALVSNVYTTASSAYIYDFKSDGTFEYSFKTTGSPAKYYLAQTGKYTLTGNEVAFSNVTSYTIKDGGTLPVAKEELVLRGASLSTNYTIGFSAKKDSLSLTIHCPINASCVGLQWYKKQ